MLYPDSHLKGKKKGRKTKRHERSQGFSAETRNQNVPGRCESNRNLITNRKEACNQPPQARIIRPTSDPNPPSALSGEGRPALRNHGREREGSRETNLPHPTQAQQWQFIPAHFLFKFSACITIRDCRHVQTPTVADLHSYIST